MQAHAAACGLARVHASTGTHLDVVWQRVCGADNVARHVALPLAKRVPSNEHRKKNHPHTPQIRRLHAQQVRHGYAPGSGRSARALDGISAITEGTSAPLHRTGCRRR